MNTFLINKSIPSIEVVTNMQTLYLHQRAQRIVYSKWCSDFKNDFFRKHRRKKEMKKGRGKLLCLITF